MIHCQSCGERIGVERLGRFLAWYAGIALLITVVLLVVLGGMLPIWALALVVVAILLVVDFLFSVLIARTARFTMPNRQER